MEKLKACALGCKVSIIEYVDEYIKLMSERGACQKVADLINKYAEAELYSAGNIRNYYRFYKGKDKLAEIQPPWTGQYESYTPQKYIDSVKQVMGDIDLDPASTQKANERIKAKKIFDIKENGLMQKWFGRVFLNPPYKQPEIGLFISKLITEILSGNVIEAILLTNNNTDTRWFTEALIVSELICFTNHRIKFEIDGEKPTYPTTGQVFFYFGKNEKKFIEIFSDQGVILCEMNHQKQ
jgi:hypothetical protein